MFKVKVSFLKIRFKYFVRIRRLKKQNKLDITSFRKILKLIIIYIILLRIPVILMLFLSKSILKLIIKYFEKLRKYINGE
jgi:hypothetical protein